MLPIFNKNFMKTFFAILDMKLLMWTCLRNLIGFWRGTLWVQYRHWSSTARWDLNENFTISSFFWFVNGITLLMSISICKGPIAVPDNNHYTLKFKMWTLVISYLLMSNVWLYPHMIPILCARKGLKWQYNTTNVIGHLLIIKQPEHLGFKPLTPFQWLRVFYEPSTGTFFEQLDVDPVCHD